MPRKLFCNNSAKSEIYVEDSRGKELFFESLAPPVEVIWGVKMFRYRANVVVYTSGINTFYEKRAIDVLLQEGQWDDSEIVFFRDKLLYSNQQPSSGRPTRFLVERTFYNSETSEFTKKTIKDVSFPRPKYGGDYIGNQTFYYAPGNGGIIDNYSAAVTGFAIQDTEQVLFFVEKNLEYPLPYRVECINCPDGLCAVRGRKDVVCLDCEKVKSSLNRMSSALDRLLN